MLDRDAAPRKRPSPSLSGITFMRKRKLKITFATFAFVCVIAIHGSYHRPQVSWTMWDSWGATGIEMLGPDQRNFDPFSKHDW